MKYHAAVNLLKNCICCVGLTTRAGHSAWHQPDVPGSRFLQRCWR